MYSNRNAYLGMGFWELRMLQEIFWGFSQSIKLGSVRGTCRVCSKGPEILPFYSVENATNRRNTVLKIWWQLVILTRENSRISLPLSISMAG